MHKKATASITLLFFLISSKAFQQTIKTDEKITIVAVSSAVCSGRAAGTWNMLRRALLDHISIDKSKSEKLIQAARLSSFGVVVVIDKCSGSANVARKEGRILGRFSRHVWIFARGFAVSKNIEVH
ncbi:hypothetical protein [Undibacterium sp. Ren11W]|uniref:hypothetical protein n=1 Tax=Undibacterium sp. Ren11W TaxID=3413045 RepID=UPI003BF3CA75